MSTPKKGLGKGLGAIIATSPKPVEALETGIVEDRNRIVQLDIDAVHPNPDQPRTHFNEEEIEGLAASIRSVGLIQPIIVRKVADVFYIVAGERRFRASRIAGLKKIKAIVIEANEEQNITLALIENIQRSNLDPIEEAKAYKVLMSRFTLKQQDIADRVGKDRATIANLLRLLSLPDEIQHSLSEGTISVGHAKVLLSLPEAKLKKYFFETIEKGLSVRMLEKAIEAEKAQPEEKAKPAAKPKNPQIRKMEELLISQLGTKVEIKHAGSQGKIEISYYSLDDFDRIIELLK